MALPSAIEPSGRSGRILPIGLLTIILIFAADTMWVQLSRNRYLDSIQPHLDGESPFMPGSQDLILRRYTGVASLDHFLSTVNVFWVNATDGSRPEFSMFVAYFGGQLASLFTIFLVEGQRRARWSKAVFNTIFWGCVMQGIGFGIAMPIFAIIHLNFTSSRRLADTVRVRDAAKLHTALPAVIFGYFLPSIILAYPFADANANQWANVLWQPFPIYVVACQTLFAEMLKRTSIGQDAFVSETKRSKDGLAAVYRFAWNIAALTHLVTLVVIFSDSILPGVFPAGVGKALTLSRVFVPVAPPHSGQSMASQAAAMHDFFRYDLYFGSVAALVWAVYLLSQVRPVLSSLGEVKKLARGVLISLLFAGPGGAVVALMAQRDEIVLNFEAKAAKSQ